MKCNQIAYGCESPPEYDMGAVVRGIDIVLITGMMIAYIPLRECKLVAYCESAHIPVLADLETGGQDRLADHLDVEYLRESLGGGVVVRELKIPKVMSPK